MRLLLSRQWFKDVFPDSQFMRGQANVSTVVGSGIYQIEDLSESGAIIRQTTGAVQPTLVDDVVKSYHGASFNGVSQYMTVDGVSVGPGSIGLLWIGNFPTAPSARQAIFDFRGAGGDLMIFGPGTSGRPAYYYSGSFREVDAAAGSISGLQWWYYRLTASSPSIYRNSTTALPFAAAAYANQSLEGNGSDAAHGRHATSSANFLDAEEFLFAGWMGTPPNIPTVDDLVPELEKLGLPT